MDVETPDETARRDAALVAAFSVLGKRWNGVLLGTLATGSASFSELRRALGGISDTVLSERLSELAHCELISREVDGGPPVAVRYGLTDRGPGVSAVIRDIDARMTRIGKG